MRWNWDGVIGVATSLGDGLYGVRISAVLRDFSLLQKSRPALGPTQPLTQYVLGFLHEGKADGD
jgi:hypothetical protein